MYIYFSFLLILYVHIWLLANCISEIHFISIWKTSLFYQIVLFCIDSLRELLCLISFAWKTLSFIYQKVCINLTIQISSKIANMTVNGISILQIRKKICIIDPLNDVWAWQTNLNNRQWYNWSMLLHLKRNVNQIVILLIVRVSHLKHVITITILMVLYDIFSGGKDIFLLAN